MNPLTNVVIGVDGSPASASALRWTIGHAPPTARLHVVHGFATLEQLARAAVRQDWGAARTTAEKDLHSTWTDAVRHAGVDSSIAFIDDHPVDALVTTIDAVNADAVIVGSHGDGASAHLLGSITRRLIRRSRVPVVVVHHPGAPEPAHPFVLACVGHGETSERAAFWAADYASARSLPLVLLHVVRFRPVFPFDPPETVLASYFGGDTPTDWAKSGLEDLTDRLKEAHPELVIRMEVARGRVSPNVAAHGVGADLIVIGRGRTEPLTHNLIGSLTRQIATRTAAPTAIVP
ncbi:MAG: universal stress protein [Acidimicrobiales bacterium]